MVCPSSCNSVRLTSLDGTDSSVGCRVGPIAAYGRPVSVPLSRLIRLIARTSGGTTMFFIVLVLFIVCIGMPLASSLRGSTCRQRRLG
jgi:hypothetical protein